MKRLVSLFLIALICLSLVPVAGEGERPAISYYAYWMGALEPQSYVEQYIEDHLNMDIITRKVTHTDKEAVNLMLASGEMPDCGWFEQNYTQMAKEELIRSIPVEMVKEHMPGFIELCEEQPMIYAMALDPDDPTQFRYFPDIYVGNASLHNNAMYLRYDWIKKLGIDLGVNVEKTADQLYVADNGISRDVFTQVLDGFVNGDPDGNGANDTFGLLKDWDISLVPSQGILFGGNMEVDGEPIDWYANPEMKELLLYVQGLYAKGLVYPEIFTVKWGEDWELINNSKAGVLSGSAVATVWLQAWANNRPPLSLFASNPEAELLMIPGIAGPDGQVHHMKPHAPGRWESFFVNADVDDEKLANILKFLNFVYFSGDDEVTATLTYGEKGVDWDWGDNGAPVLINQLQNGERGTQVFGRNMILGNAFKWTTLEPLFHSGVKYYISDEGGIWNKMLRYTYKVDISSETNAAAISAEYGKDIEAVYKAYFMDVILGNSNVEEDWDEYIQAIGKLKYGEYVNELSKVKSIEEILASFAAK